MTKTENVEEGYQFDSLSAENIKVLKANLDAGRTIHISYGGTRGTPRQYMKFTTNKGIIRNYMYNFQDKVHGFDDPNLKPLKVMRSGKNKGIDPSNALDFKAAAEKALAKKEGMSRTGIDLSLTPPDWRSIRLDRVTGFEVM